VNRTELKQLLDAGGFKESYYALNARPDGDAFFLLHELANGRWAIDSFDRGRSWTVGTYDTEDAACAALYRLLQEDPSSRV